MYPSDELARRAEADQALIEAAAAEDLERIVLAIGAHSDYGSPDAVPCIVQASLCCGMRSCAVLGGRWLMLAACVAS